MRHLFACFSPKLSIISPKNGKFLTAITVESGLKRYKSGYPKHRKLERLLHRKNLGFGLRTPKWKIIYENEGAGALKVNYGSVPTKEREVP